MTGKRVIQLTFDKKTIRQVEHGLRVTLDWHISSYLDTLDGELNAHENEDAYLVRMLSKATELLGESILDIQKSIKILKVLVDNLDVM